MPDSENSEKVPVAEPAVEPQTSLVRRILPWLIPILVIIACAVMGFGVGRLFGTRGKMQTASAAEASTPAETAIQQTPDSETGSGSLWYYDIEPVVANLNEPQVTRYVRVTLTLEVSKSLPEKDGLPFLEMKKPLMKNWLTLYLANQTLEDIRGEKNLRHMQAELADALNQGLFPNAKPQIERVLFKELSIQ